MKTVSWCWTLLTCVLGVIDFVAEAMGVQAGRWDVFFGLALIFWGLIMAMLIVEYVSFKGYFSRRQ